MLMRGSDIDPNCAEWVSHRHEYMFMSSPVSVVKAQLPMMVLSITHYHFLFAIYKWMLINASHLYKEVT